MTEPVPARRRPAKLSGTLGLGRVQEGVAIVYELAPTVRGLDHRQPSQGEEAPASEAMPADRGPASELQAQADERRLEVIWEKIVQQHDAEDNEYYLANLEEQCEASDKS
jgi:hypothetical protein